MHLVLFESILFSQVFEFRLRISSCDSDNQTSTFCEMLYFFYGWNQPKVKVHLQDCNTLYNAHSYEPNWESNERKVCYGSLGMGMKHNHASHKWSTSHLHRQELSFEWEKRTIADTLDRLFSIYMHLEIKHPYYLRGYFAKDLNF